MKRLVVLAILGMHLAGCTGAKTVELTAVTRDLIVANEPRSGLASLYIPVIFGDAEEIDEYGRLAIQCLDNQQRWVIRYPDWLEVPYLEGEVEARVENLVILNGGAQVHADGMIANVSSNTNGASINALLHGKDTYLLFRERTDPRRSAHFKIKANVAPASYAVAEEYMNEFCGGSVFELN